jgi:hypothetical protein
MSSKNMSVLSIALLILILSAVLWLLLAPVPGAVASPAALGPPLPLLLPGDTCQDATYEVRTLPYNMIGFTSAQADDYQLGTEGWCAGGGTWYDLTGVGPDAVWLIATDRDCSLNVNLDPESADLALYVLSPDCSDVGGNCVFVDDAGAAGIPEDVPLDAIAGQPYYIIVDGYDGDSGNFELTIIETSSTDCELVEAGEHSLGGWTWYDTDRDGIQGTWSNEFPVEGIGVSLYHNADCSGTAVATQTTDYLGDYVFDVVPSGNYCVAFRDIPAGWTISPQDQSVDGQDSDVDPATGQVTVTLFSDHSHLDMGVYAGGDIGGRVWCDENRSGAYDPGEAIAGGVIDLRRDPECDGTPGEGLAYTQSGAAGRYVFTDFFVGPPGVALPECYVVLGGDPACRWGCCDPITQQEHSVELDAANPDSLDNDFGFKPDLSRIYLPIVLR